jgi:hypothetical protein
MAQTIVSFTSVILVAISMAAGWAHLLEMRAKLRLSGEQYLTVQQIYRGWALLGFVVVGALASTVSLATLAPEPRTALLSAAAAACVGLTLAIFVAITNPVNRATANWTSLPANWADLRRLWEWSHAANAVLYFAALVMLTIAFVGTG